MLTKIFCTTNLISLRATLCLFPSDKQAHHVATVDFLFSACLGTYLVVSIHFSSPVRPIQPLKGSFLFINGWLYSKHSCANAKVGRGVAWQTKSVLFSLFTGAHLTSELRIQITERAGERKRASSLISQLWSSRSSSVPWSFHPGEINHVKNRHFPKSISLWTVEGKRSSTATGQYSSYFKGKNGVEIDPYLAVS